MNVAEGARRMQFAGRWMVFFALIAAGLFLIMTLIVAYLPSGSFIHGIALLGFIPLSVPIATVGAILWLAGWIVEGFSKKTQ
jgi:cadmium resistance protein CadD (predicted permease)